MDLSCDLPGASRTAGKGAFPDPSRDIAGAASPQTAVFAAGCFWCVEAVFKQLDGVLSLTSGYSGGTATTANYETVCSGRTDHAEVVKIEYDPARISYGRLLKIFFSVAHDPTQLNRQGNDHGRQYRSAIFFESEAQADVARAYIDQLGKAGVFTQPIVTEVVPLKAFYNAEAYHQNYAELHPNQPYIAGVSTPKVEKLKQKYGEYLRK